MHAKVVLLHDAVTACPLPGMSTAGLFCSQLDHATVTSAACGARASIQLAAVLCTLGKACFM